ncbi:MAG: shikimate kinase [Firmicutes bacterium]|nr:shikimate kinase [Bacillota bacterium]
MKSNLVIIGFMGVGKTTNGRRVAKKLRKGFIDTDFFIEYNCNTKINKIFQRYGEAHFRKLEKKAVKEVSKRKNVVISTGGGVVLDPSNIKELKRNGIIILLQGSIKHITRNLENSYKKRPLLEKENWKMELRNILESRKKRYFNSSDYIIKVDGKSHGQIVNEIVKAYKRRR